VAVRFLTRDRSDAKASDMPNPSVESG
jgi:hypothetical protein